jgi:DNA-directed RNA polymerase specialized sigma24 family protein
MRTPDELVGRVAARQRETLLDSYRRVLPREDLEDALGQAVLEILLAGRRRTFADECHLANALHQKFRSRIIDRRRALAGRSPIERALATSMRVQPVGELSLDVADPCAEVEGKVVALDELRRIIRVAGEQLTADQRAVITHAAGGGRRAEFIAQHGWGSEKYRKVGQRGRARLRRALAASATGVDV